MSGQIDASAIQRALVAKGYAVGEIDGKIGKRTLSAIRRAVWDVAGPRATVWPDARMLIAFEQIMLRDAKLYEGTIDGEVGRLTKRALASWAERSTVSNPAAPASDWATVLRAVCPHGRAEIVAGAADAMPRMIELAALTTPLRQAHFLAQIAHESAGMLTTVEYASGSAYEGRKDLGNTQPGDGVRFKGRGLIQLTGRANYTAYGFELGLDLVGKPALAAQFPAAALTAALYWRKRAINVPADRDDIEAVTRKINGGTNGLADRRAYLKAAKRALAA